MTVFKNRVILLSLVFATFFIAADTYAGINPDSDSTLLDWSNPIKIIDVNGQSQTVMHFSGAVYNRLSIPKKVIKIKGKLSSFSLLNPQTTPLTKKERQLVPADFSSGDFSITLKYGYERKEIYTLVYISNNSRPKNRTSQYHNTVHHPD